MAKSSAKKWAIGTVIAAAAGYIAGLLTAPKSGKETRQDLEKTAKQDIDKAEAELKRLQAEINTVTKAAKLQAAKLKGEAKQEATVLMAKAEEAKAKAQDIIKAVKAGEADDRDLQEALNGVNSAVEHLKKYLKKS